MSGSFTPVISKQAVRGKNAQLSWLLAMVAGMVGAVAFLHTSGYFVTFMTGNTERAVLGWFEGGDPDNLAATGALSAAALIVSFTFGVFSASLFRRHVWKNAIHGSMMFSTIGLMAAAFIDFALEGFTEDSIPFYPVLIIAFSLGGLNTAFIKNGEVSIPLSYMTGTLVKLGQGIERHVSGKGNVYDWLVYVLLYGSFIAGALIGGLIGFIFTGPQVLFAAGLLCGIITVVTYFMDRTSDARVEVESATD